MKSSNLFAILAAFACAALLPSTGLSKTWYVASDGTGDFTKVQPGINAALIGDTVLVAPGTYLENIRLAGRDIVLKSQAGPEMTTLDGSSQDRSVVEFFNGETNACVLEGFTITGGRGSAIVAGEKKGGGIFAQDAEPSILNNVIRNNTALTTMGTGEGGGVFFRAALPNQFAPVRVPRIIGNTIDSNVAGLNAGGIGLQEKVSAVISGNTIMKNRTLSGDGGGIWILVRQSPEIVIENNKISANDASDHGGGIYAVNSFHGATPPLLITIRRNQVLDNLARGRARTGDSGGGVWLYCTDAAVVLNTIVRNVGQGVGNAYGGGILILGPGSPVIERNVIALTPQGGGILCRDGATPVITNNLVWSNDGGNALGSCSSWVGTDGNIQADPLFCGAANDDYSLPPNSPALTHPAGPFGAISVPGCTMGVLVESTTWGAIKAGRWE